MSVLGLDPSTHTGWCLVSAKNKKPVASGFGEIYTVDQGIKRAKYISDRVLNIVVEHEPKLIIIEGYGFANRHSLATLVEIGTMIRAVCDEVVPWGEVAPAALKKFITSRGTSKKDVMKLETYKRWGFEGTDNEVDAFALAAFGLACLTPHLVQLTAFQSDLVGEWRAKHYRLVDY